MRQFSSALAHELRTPLAAMRGEIELALLKYDRSRGGRAGEPDRRDRQADAPGQSAADAGSGRVGEIRLAREAVDLATLAATVTEQLEPVAQSKN